jgi:hypothetical protein
MSWKHGKHTKFASKFGCQVWLSDGTGTFSEMPVENIKVRLSWQKS